MAATRIDGKTARVGVSIHVSLYRLEYSTNQFTLSDSKNIRDLIRENTIHTIVAYTTSNSCGTPGEVGKQADAAARECVRCFCPDHNPALSIGFRNKVMPDAEVVIRLVQDLKKYKESIPEPTGNTVLASVYELGGYKYGKTKGDQQSAPIKITFFSATPQSGGVALMYIPEPDSEAFRITKTNHNIPQGVGDPEARSGAERQAVLDKCMRRNGESYWVSPSGLFAPGGADVIIIDDLQMETLISWSTRLAQKEKLVTGAISAISKSARTLWQSLGALRSRYGSGFGVAQNKRICLVVLSNLCVNGICNEKEMYVQLTNNLCIFVIKLLILFVLPGNYLLYLSREYITQIATLDRSKDVPDVIESYLKFIYDLNSVVRSDYSCGHGAIDAPEAQIVYNETIALLTHWRYAPIAKDVIVVKIGPRDQSFEVKVSEALHHGKPLVATQFRNIPLRIEDGKSGFLVKVGHTATVANCLLDHHTNDDHYTMMSKNAKASMSDQVGTLIMEMAKKEAGQKYGTSELILPRAGLNFKGTGKNPGALESNREALDTNGSRILYLSWNLVRLMRNQVLIQNSTDLFTALKLVQPTNVIQIK
ncbi:hypothetical protein HOY80DRAFT_1080369 [Tuber brumale]|nr:hypothetical protein HOY80DRAFT_1080369 [Tuber brumale]